jgi:hypothetical protein
MTTITATALSAVPDLELSPMSPSPTDPYSLQARLIPKEELTSLRQRGFRRKVRKFYEDQNANIERMLKSVDEHRLAADIEHEEKQMKVSSLLPQYSPSAYFLPEVIVFSLEWICALMSIFFRCCVLSSLTLDLYPS